MKSATKLILLLGIAPLASGCAGSIQVLAPTVGCSSLIPKTWEANVPSASLPHEAAAESDWQVFGIQQTGQLALANGQKRDAIEIVRTCEARDAAAVREVTRPWWRVWG